MWREAERLGIVRELAASRGRLSAGERQQLATVIVREARRYDLDPRLVLAVIRIESGASTRAVSPKGAIGLMQLMPATGLWLAKLADDPLPGPEALFEIERNVALGCQYLRALLRQFGALEQALLAYNAGPAQARKLLADPRTAEAALRGYARRVLDEFARLSGGGAVAAGEALKGGKT